IVLVLDSGGHAQRSIGQGLLQRPVAVAWRANGTELWVVDAAAHGVFVFDSTGDQKTQFGGRGSAAGRFNFPAGLCAIDSVAGVAIRPDSPLAAVIADSMNFRVQLFDQLGHTLASFGKKGDAAGDFSLPRDVAVDSQGHIYVLDNQFENVQIFGADGRLLL